MTLSRRITACRFCDGSLSIPFCDLGATPLANSYVDPARAGTPDKVFPLNAMVCERCHLVQLDHIVDANEIFSDYAYFSSFSTSWMEHARHFATGAAARFGLGAGSFVVEIASNDGYLLHNFVAAGIPCLGVEPAANVAAAAERAGVPTRVAFFGAAEARAIVAGRGHADLVIANNVLAHVPDINDFVEGLAILAGPRGLVSIEAPHLLALVRQVQFDTIYHEHYAYWSLHAMRQVLEAHGLLVRDVRLLPTHGTSLRVLAGRPASWAQSDLAAVAEAEAGVATADFYAGFAPRVAAVLDGFRRHIKGKRIAAYGAAAKGNTFLNAAGVTARDILMVADRNPAKQGRLLPGSRIPIVPPEALAAARPEQVVILPWNLATEIANELKPLIDAPLVVAVPRLRRVG
jgi:hypothetical protein